MAILPDRQTDSGEGMAEINTTPLIDVMLVVLIMLIVTIPARTDAVKLDLPQGTPPPSPPVVVRLDIAADDTLRWNGAMLPDRTALETALAQAARQDPQPELDLNTDPQSRFAAMAMVLAEAQRVGIMKIGIVPPRND
jgi:biopolymer transport protein ExbD